MPSLYELIVYITKRIIKNLSILVTLVLSKTESDQYEDLKKKPHQ